MIPRTRIGAVAATFLLLALVLLVLVQSQAARQGTPSQVPATRNVATQIILPPQLETDKPATLAVLDGEGRSTPGVTVSLSDGRRITTDSSGRARFVVTSDMGDFIAEAPGDVPGGVVRASSTVLGPQQIPAERIAVTDYPRVLALDDLIVIRGVGFRGDADINTATLSGRPAVVLASSPASLVLQSGPGVAPGPASLSLDVADHKAGPFPLTFVSLEVEQPVGTLAIGKKNQFVVHVKGTERQLALAVRNLSPANVDLTGGNLQRVTTTGGPNNSAVVAMRATNAGDFSISVRVVPGTSGAPDLPLVRRELLAAKSAAQGDWILRLDHALARLDQLDRDPRELGRLQGELEQIYSAGPPPEMGVHLQSAWAAVLRP